MLTLFVFERTSVNLLHGKRLCQAELWMSAPSTLLYPVVEQEPVGIGFDYRLGAWGVEHLLYPR